MSKHKRRSDERYNEQQFNNPNPYGTNPQQQLMDIIGNIGNGDMSQIANLLSSLNGDGVNFNNLDMNNMGNISPNNMGNTMGMNPNMPPQDFNPLQILLSGLAGGGIPFPNVVNKKKPDSKRNSNNNDNSIKEEKNNIEFKSDLVEEENDNSEERENIIVNEDDDDIIRMLKSIKVLVEPKRVKFIDRVIELYLTGEFNDVI